MFVELIRINQEGHKKPLTVDIKDISFLTQAEDHICYDKPTEFVESVDVDTGETQNEPVAWETEERFVVAFKNGKHPQFLDRANYEKLNKILLSN